MGLGVLEPASETSSLTVPGTSLLLDNDLQGQRHLVRVPKPTSSLNDPLNWPLWKKDMLLFSLSFCVALGGIQGSILSVATAQIAADYGITLIQAEYFSSYPFLSCGAVCVLSSVLSRLIGKRPVYLVSALLELASCIWSALSTSYHSQLASRIVYGLGVGAFEAVVLSSIGDLYFIHERGRRLAFYSAMGLGCVQLSPVLGGYVTQTYGWQTQFWILTAFWVVALGLVFFAVPETTFDRPLQYETDMGVARSGASSVCAPSPTLKGADEKTAPTADTIESSIEQPRSYAKQLLPFRRLESRLNPLKLTLRLFASALYPAVWTAFLSNGIFVGWFTAIVVVLAQIFAVPPFNFSPAQLGYLNTFCFPGALLAFALTHTLSDRIAEWLARRNGRVYEPEFRLVLVAPAVVVGVLGFSLFGWYTGSVIAGGNGSSWVLTSFFYGMIIFAVVEAQAVAYAYLLDAHREISVETGVFAIMLRNFFSYGATTFTPLWLETSGVANTFYAIAGIQGGVIVLSCGLMYVFGKRVRAFLGQHNPMKALRSDVSHE